MDKLIKNMDKAAWKELKIIALKKGLTIPETIKFLVFIFNQKEKENQENQKKVV